MLNPLVIGSHSESRATFRAAFVDSSWSLAFRLAVVLIALAILYLRIPSDFVHPQFWGEDIDFFYGARYDGWKSLLIAPVGYLVTIQYLVAVLASYFSPASAPIIYNYTAILLTLIVVWLVTSPRLDMPCKPLLAIAVVIVPMGYEELGTITNIQWILPLGAFTLLFMRPGQSVTVLAGESVLLGLMSVSGPFSIFLTPLFLLRRCVASGAIERLRMNLLTFIVGLGCLIQVLVIVSHRHAGAVSPSPYSWTLWFNMPLSQVMTIFGPVSSIFQGIGGVALAIIFIVLAIALACQPPYRTQKLFMFFFATAIAVGGMYKFRNALGTQVFAQRYFYVGSVFSLWFICCMSVRPYLQTTLATFVALTELLQLPIISNSPRIVDDMQWPIWASYLSSGLPTLVPSSPHGYNKRFPATTEGPLARFSPWVGKNIFTVAGGTDASSCAGFLSSIERTPGMKIHHQHALPAKESWITGGSSWDTRTSSPVQLVALVDSSNEVLGFGLPKFSYRSPTANVPPWSGWIGIVYARPKTIFRAFAILDDGQRICPLANTRSSEATVQRLGSQQFVGAIEIIPGRLVMQRFATTKQLERLSVTFVNFGRATSRYTVNWHVVAYNRGLPSELGVGKINAGDLHDWQAVELPLTISKEVPEELEVSFGTDAGIPPATPIGLPTYLRAAGTTEPPAEVGGIPIANDAQLGLTYSE